MPPTTTSPPGKAGVRRSCLRRQRKAARPAPIGRRLCCAWGSCTTTRTTTSPRWRCWSGPARPPPVEWRPSFLHGYVLKQTSQLPSARAVLEGVRSRLETQGDEAALPFLLFTLSELECWAGNLQRAAEHAEAGEALAMPTGQGL